MKERKFQIYYYENDELVDSSFSDYQNMRGAIDDAEDVVANAERGKDFRADVVVITTVATVDRHF
jgi:hypothetical protein